MTGQKRKEKKQGSSDLRGDYGNIAFLLLLYILQGIPLGLSAAVPLLLQNKKVAYSDQALFSFVFWPFSLKLLWAPIVDSIYWRWMGRRKSWLVPVQLGIGLFMLVLSGLVNDLLKDDPTTGQKPNIYLLTSIFLMLNFLAATQDIAVDGWALTMLKRRNVGYASTCNTVGQTAGYFMGNIIFLALESSKFCNAWLRSEANQSDIGVVTFEGVLYYTGILFIILTVLIAIIKSEKGINTDVYETSRKKSKHESKNLVRLNKINRDCERDINSSDEDNDEHVEQLDLTVKETYSLLYKIMKLPPFQLFALILFTFKIGFAAPDAVTGLKLLEVGLSKESAAMMAVPMVPLQIFLPWIISRMTCGPRPLNIMISAYPYRLLFGLIFPLVVYVTPYLMLQDKTFPIYYYALLVFVYGLHQITVYCIYVSSMAFHAAISDPKIGGTYMTLLNTITNLGGNWPSTLSLWLVDGLTVKDCTETCRVSSNLNVTTSKTGSSSEKNCEKVCNTFIDGYYVECVICVLIGYIWLKWGASKMRKLQELPLSSWSVSLDTKKL